jgi:hypothetical protein
VGKCEGRKSHAELNPDLVALAKGLRRQKPKGGRSRCGSCCAGGKWSAVQVSRLVEAAAIPFQRASAVGA